MDMEERVAMLEFQVELLFNNTSIDRLFFETKVTREQYKAILNLMDSFRTKIENGEDTHHYAFENAIYQIVPERNGDYHFCEMIAKLFAENGQWDEVFTVLYGDMPKYRGIAK